MNPVTSAMVYDIPIQTKSIAPIINIPNSFVPPSNLSNDNTSWFKGGTLHKSTIKEWRQATYANRLATAADFIAATQDVDYGNLDKFKEMAVNLEICISTAAEGGSADDEKTAFISAVCTVEMFPK